MDKKRSKTYHKRCSLFCENQCGSALPVVIMFATVGCITATAYISAQYTICRPSFRAPVSLQALLTSRSGIFTGLEKIHTRFHHDNLHPQRYNSDVREHLQAGLFPQKDTVQPNEDELPVNGPPVVVDPFSAPKFGSCVLTFETKGVFLSLRSRGIYRNRESTCSALLGSQPFLSTDTVLYVSGNLPPTGLHRVLGSVSLIPADTSQRDESVRDFRKRTMLHEKDVEVFLSEFNKAVASYRDSTIERIAYEVSSPYDLRHIPHPITGDCIIDGTRGTISWNDSGVIVVYGDLQLSGYIDCTNQTFFVGGDIKLLDHCRFRSVALFSKSRIFFGDERTLCSVVFSGTAVADGDIEICRDTRIMNRSLILSRGIIHPSGTTKKPDETAPREPSDAPSDDTYAIYIRDDAEVDGVVMSLSNHQGIMTFPQSKCRGILWSESRINHRGTLEGIMYTRECIGGEDTEKNGIDGWIKEYSDSKTYYLPFFIGTPVLFSWHESPIRHASGT